jgi:phosphatidylserine decarboxylase
MSLSIFFQYALPHRFLSRLALWVARCRIGFFKNWLIGLVVRTFNVNMQEAQNSDPYSYESFAAFFTRAMKPGVHTADADPHTLLMPADGKVSQVGKIESGRIFQAKGQDYTAAELLGDDELAKQFINGSFANIYLSPRDYHRVHMPWGGRLRETRHVPGRLFSVAPSVVNEIPRLFARNERLVCVFDTDFGPMVSVMVGAILVSGVETVWSGIEIPRYASSPVLKKFSDKNITLDRFGEMARFNYGSTVILLFPDNAVELDHFEHQAPTRVGQRLGRVLKP